MGLQAMPLLCVYETHRNIQLFDILIALCFQHDNLLETVPIKGVLVEGLPVRHEHIHRPVETFSYNRRPFDSFHHGCGN